ncbi:MAG TPA: NAD(P)/FAD-dependent oxidoreductase [Noviherbaspirillum sp.]|uniref:NAD(P)/FAD-dependent oxidoreductase n=1 Tax=Noviherbaspirillum sp. TaxID=1926288 RepID=UPI002D2A1EE8|nr:NAD(P)/FAD-dependent oxidoreductase [Noviherbaspirillum sp.]HYD94776.1 NAD(P)/FAD-dependent oxidoreductase [Noviherbaspirillum sp.]
MDSSAALDCAIIGAGAAGLTAATYLARFRRRFVIFDGGSSRLLSVPTSHNYPGYTDGIHGKDLLARLRAQVAGYGVDVTPGTVDGLERLPDGSFMVRGESRQWQARTAILATGVVDVEPDFPDVKEAVANGHVRYCPICDGFEATGKRVAVAGRGKGGLGEALFVRNYTEDIVLLSLTEPIVLDDEERQRIDRAGLRVIHTPAARLAYAGDGIEVHLQDGGRERVEVLYGALGTMVNSGMAQLLGAEHAPDGCLLVDPHQQTSVDGLYAAGDVVAGLNQIAVAMGQAAIAATAVHNRLRG